MSTLNEQIVAKFYREGGETKLRYNYPLDNNSLVIDLGGYTGQFSEKISSMYNCNIELYEPVLSYYEICEKKFKDNPKINVHKAGVSNNAGTIDININAEGSSLYGPGEIKECIDLIDIVNVVKDKHIDLMKINIEGPEFEIMERLIECNLLANIENFQIQFHNFNHIDNPISRRNSIRAHLSKSHKITYDFPFVWENWEKLS